ncbi:MAG: Tad domain-containing protein [Desulfobacteraceae bacterium]|nr:Tad domain-containing protein [Desulfobacteraceae bacterium]
MIVIALVMFTIVCFIALTVNVGHRITKKVELQNAADAAVMSGAIWNARGMNMISLLNVGMSECLAMVIIFRAYKKTVGLSYLLVKVNYGVAVACCAATGWTGIGLVCCVAERYYAWLLSTALPSFLEKVGKAMTGFEKDGGLLWQWMNSLAFVADKVKIAVPWVAAYEAHHIALKNGAGDLTGGFLDQVNLPFKLQVGALLLPLPNQNLPAELGTFHDLCVQTKDQGCTQYQKQSQFEQARLDWHSLDLTDIPFIGHLLGDPEFNGLGVSPNFSLPLVGKTSFQDMIFYIYGTVMIGVMPNPGLIYKAMVYGYSENICSGQPVNVPIKESTGSCSECDTKENATVKYSPVNREDEIQISSPNVNTCNLTGTQKKVPANAYIVDKRPEMDDEPCIKCNIKTIEYYQDCDCTLSSDCSNCDENDENGTRVITEHYRTDYRVLEECSYESNQIIDSAPQHKPLPLMLATGWQDRLKYTVIVRNDDVGDKFPLVSSDSDSDTWATAQAEVYNPTEAHLFNQDWQVRLKPWKLEDVDFRIGGFDISKKIPGFNKISQGAESIILH